MGISLQLFNKYNKIKTLFNSNMTLLELGDQDICFNPHYGKKFRNSNEKFFYKDWKTLDLHERNGVTIKDLSILNNDIGKWDIITNFGTSEHVEPEVGHYNCWKNIHNWLFLGGYSIHELPEVGAWPNHCRYYYNEDFFNHFTKIGYEIIENSTIFYEDNGNLRFCIMKKIKDISFFSNLFFDKIVHIEKNNTSITINPENNPKGLIF
jgi:hypothetical protein